MRTAELLNLIFFLLFSVVAWLRPLSSQRRIRIVSLGAIGIALVLAVSFADQFLPTHAVSVARDWLPAPLMPMMYWLAGSFSGKPNQNFQNQLQRLDQRWLGDLLPKLATQRSYRWASAGLELAYLSCYVLVPFGLAALYLGHMRRHANQYWSVVLLATYPCYALTAFVQTLPPRMLSTDTWHPAPGKIRWFNLWIVRHASIQLNTFPSAHVTATLGGSLVLLHYMPATGLVFLLASLGIAVGAVTGRYHYAADVICAAVLTLGIYAIVMFAA
jgi:hypothetical protein